MNGKSEILDLIEDLTKRKDKDSRINLNKISNYIDLLKQNGLKLGQPYIKHLER